jgi:mannan endo-1,6-alpha-mannosidase
MGKDADGAWQAEYQNFTGDARYEGEIVAGLLSQRGVADDYIFWELVAEEVSLPIPDPSPRVPPADDPPREKKANDDQIMWGFSLLAAHAAGLRTPPTAPGWLTLARNLLASQTPRWDAATCGGGLRWQWYPNHTNPDAYHYKNAITNGGSFALAAELFRVAGDPAHARWAAKVWDWSIGVGLVDVAAGAVQDGLDARTGCAPRAELERWTYTLGAYVYGAANMAAAAGTPAADRALWLGRVKGLLRGLDYFLAAPLAGGGGGADILSETRCEARAACDADQAAHKGLLGSWLARSVALLPDADPARRIRSVLRASAVAAARAVDENGSGGPLVCNERWWGARGNQRAGAAAPGAMECFAALKVVQAALIV